MQRINHTDPSKSKDSSNQRKPSVFLKLIGSLGESLQASLPQKPQMKDWVPFKKLPLQCLQRRYGGEGSRAAMDSSTEGRLGSDVSSGLYDDRFPFLRSEICSSFIRSIAISAVISLITNYVTLLSSLCVSVNISVHRVRLRTLTAFGFFQGWTVCPV